MKKTIVDVRTKAEFESGNVKGSINIPLNELPNRLEELRQLTHPLVLCCASGARSANAVAYLQSNGINCENGGSWVSVSFNMN